MVSPIRMARLVGYSADGSVSTAEASTLIGGMMYFFVIGWSFMMMAGAINVATNADEEERDKMVRLAGVWGYGGKR